jgi:hypothetical protein
MQIQLDEETLARLRDVAHSTHRPVAAVVREALSGWLERRDPHEPAVPGKNHDKYLVVGDLVSVAEIARRLGHPVSTVQTWRRRYETFPRPLATLAARPVWDWDQVEPWVRRHAAGETRRRRSRGRDTWPADLPGAELVSKGVDDLANGRLSIESALVSMATGRLRELGVEIRGAPIAHPSDRLYELVEKRVGEAGAHSRYNALRRRLSSFLRALAVANAQAS